MNEDGNFLSQKLLEFSLSRVELMVCNCSLYLFLGKECENLDVALGIFIGYIEPELVELVRRGSFRIELDVAFLGLAELLSVSLSDEWAGQCVCVGLAEHSSDKFSSGSDVSPLVASAHLQMAVLVLIEPEEIVSLEQLVAELCE